jgi:hypothetical protein
LHRWHAIAAAVASMAYQQKGRRAPTGREDARRRLPREGVEARRRVREHQLARPRAADAVVRARAVARRRRRI